MMASKKTLLGGLMLASLYIAPAHASLIGSEMSLQFIYQETEFSAPIVTSILQTAIVTEMWVEFPDASLLDNTAGVGAGLLPTMYDAGENWVDVSFGNVGDSGVFLDGFMNTAIITFTADEPFKFISVLLSPYSNLGIDLDAITFEGNQLFINFAGVEFDETSLLSLELEMAPVPLPPAILLLGTALAGLPLFKRRGALTSA